MKKYLPLLVCICLGFGVLSGYANALLNSAKVTLLVVDEEGQPLEGVDAGVGFERNTGWGTDANAQRGLTDENGRFTASGSCNGHIGYGARKEGYYRSHYDFDFKELGKFGWKPWDPELKIVMRKIEKPVPMYARNTKFSNKKIRIPVVGKDVGFDLIVYDWVPPYGNGQYADFIFSVENKYVDRGNYDASLTIKFANKQNGIIKVEEDLSGGSQFKLVRIAPFSGYNSEITLKRYMSPGGKYFEEYKKTDNYIFRVRSNGKDGEEFRAIYGKIRGPISFDPRKEPVEIYFKYYLNPDYTQNLEFDPKRNLFGNLNELELVNEP